MKLLGWLFEDNSSSCQYAWYNFPLVISFFLLEKFRIIQVSSIATFIFRKGIFSGF
ncbi:conserved hypothetical protein [Listeria monocytogenes FSL N1-017]|nr:hypothetical protein LMOh7858_0775 [Listeria monocytogenes str. 4b H7858] [Listeria monocytogenes serotype 4b str. H7858]EEW19042.1 conserved hypothetical protein [Listeria monocytogenes FSL R2-503]EFF95593.1 conserved hypothetical protein [Listeria monocytogenes HPB2262]EFG00998.1 conserved hypothetical protein [Listeria monocytogenes FSL J1-194]EFK41930.1 conserved hypothetical protein [Listeria monocytogenes FSL N1-017]